GSCGITEPAAELGNKGVDERPRLPVEAQDLADLPRDVEVPVRAEDQSRRYAESPAGCESVEERAGLPVVAQDAVAEPARHVEVAVRTESNPTRKTKTAARGEEIGRA